VAASAQAWANNLAANCAFYHGGHNGQGQNLYASGGALTQWSQIVDSWYNEVSKYRWARGWVGE
jgi:hypothetical protein